MNKKALLTGALSLALCAVSQAAVNYVGTPGGDVATVIDLSSDPSGTYGGSYSPATATSRAVWSWAAADQVVLEDIVIITGGDLYIEPGTIVRGQPRSAAGVYDPGALLIARGAKILAQGNSTAPIVFTTAATSAALEANRIPSGSQNTALFWDQVKDNDGNYVTPQSPLLAGKWGGVLMCGNAPTNVDRDTVGTQDFFGIENPAVKGLTTDDRSSIEGIPTTSVAFTGGHDRFGGFAEADNSGILSYASIRHGGANLSSNNEINGLTVGGLGRGTTINNIEIWGNTDDGVEIFGGTVNMDHILVVAPQDDGLDLDVGYTGTVQFLCVIASTATDKLAEWDGSYDGAEVVNGFANNGAVTVTRTPVAQFTVANATFIGNNGGTSTTSSGFHVRDQAAPRLVNSIIVGSTSQGSPVSAGPIEFDNRATGTYSTGNMLDKEISYFKGVSLWDNTAQAKTTWTQWVISTSSAGAALVQGKLSDAKFANNPDNNPGFTNIPVGALTSGLNFDPKPTSADSAVFEDDFVAASGSYLAVGYRGAFDPAEALLWTADWSAADLYDLVVK